MRLNFDILEHPFRRYLHEVETENLRGLGDLTTSVNRYTSDKFEEAKPLIKFDENWLISFLYRAISHQEYYGARFALSLLSDYPMPANIFLYAMNHYQYSICRLILEQCSIVNRFDTLGNTPLMTAVIYDKEDMIRYLMENNADPYLCNEKGKSVFDLNNFESYASLIFSYLEHPLHVCAQRYSYHVFEVLIQYFPLGIQNEKRQTPLHIAVNNDREEIVRLICRYHLFLDIRDENDDTALDIAQRRGYTHLVRILIEAPEDDYLLLS